MRNSSRQQSSDAHHAAGLWVINPGSSSIKWSWYAAASASAPEFSGQADSAQLETALTAALAQRSADTAVVRFVHGGTRFTEPLLIDTGSLRALREVADLAPLHNRHSLACSELMLRAFPTRRLIAVFDTEFFERLPEAAQLYGLPEPLRLKYGIRRFGFHGFAHAGMLRFWKEARGMSASRLITLQLGSGCSMAAIRDGQPIDTTMGFTPNEGLLMSSRCGDIDAGLVTWLQRREGWDADETDRQLNQQSGWLGMTGLGTKFSDLLASDAPGPRRALDLFRHRVRKTLGAYYALLGGLDGIVLSGGIAEHSPAVCRLLLADLAHLGVTLQTADIAQFDGNSLRLSTPDARVACWIASGREHEAILDSIMRAGMAS